MKLRKRLEHRVSSMIAIETSFKLVIPVRESDQYTDKYLLPSDDYTKTYVEYINSEATPHCIRCCVIDSIVKLLSDCQLLEIYERLIEHDLNL